MTPLCLPVSELKAALPGLSKTLPRHSTLPILQCVKLERSSEGWISLTTTDLDHFVSVRLEQPSKGEPLALLVPHDKLVQFTKNRSKDAIMELSPGDHHTVVMRCQVACEPSEIRISSCPVPEFPALPKMEGPAIPLPDLLRSRLHEAMACVGSDPTRVPLQGACFDVSNPDGHYVVGTDGRHLYSSNSFHLPLPHSVIVPKHKFLGWRDFNLDGSWQLKTGTSPKEKDIKWVQLSSRRWQFIARAIPGPYPQWNRALPDQSLSRVQLVLSETAMTTALQALDNLPFHDPDHQTVGLEWCGGELHLLGKEEFRAPWVRVRLRQVEGKGADLTVFIDRRMLRKAWDFGLNTLQMIDELSALRLSQGGRQMVIMPMRGQAQVKTGRAPRPPVPATLPRTAPAPAPPPPPPARPPEPTVPVLNMDDALALLDDIREGHARGLQQARELHQRLKTLQRGQRDSHRELQTIRHRLRSLHSVAG